jgi:hypothetical protein
MPTGLLSVDRLLQLHNKRASERLIRGHRTHATETLRHFLKLIETELRKFGFQSRSDPAYQKTNHLNNVTEDYTYDSL